MYDSEKKRPLYSRTVEDAVAKRTAVVQAFDEFLKTIEGIKKTV